MTFLPIVERELREAARRKLTYWNRPFAAVLFALLFAVVQILVMEDSGPGVSLGEIEFAVLKWALLVVTCLAGVFLTADSLSEERREGTLGLLFLTDLRGYDIVLGKLVSHALRSFYCLLAAFPILGLTLLIGGVTGTEFWRVTLVICNTLFLSLSLGIFVSSMSHDSMKAMNAALLLCLLLSGGLVLADFAIAGWDPTQFEARLSFASPFYLFAETGAYRYHYFWPALGLQHGLAWVFLVVACLRAPRMWREKSMALSGRRSLFKWLRFGGRRSRDATRRRLLDKRPILWLASRDRWLARFAWSVAALVVLAWAWGLVNAYYIYDGWRNPQPVFWEPLLGISEILLGCGVVFWVALQASRLFVEAMRTGALELVLVTPVSPRQIVSSQLTALCRAFAFPTACFLTVQLVVDFLQIHQMQNVSSPAGMGFDYRTYEIVDALAFPPAYLMTVLAVAWFGMWMGLTNRKGAIAVLKIIGLVLLLPWLLFWFLQMIVFSSVTYSRGALAPWLSLAIPYVLSLCKDAFFILWSRRRLRTRFREVAAQSGRAKRRWFKSRPPALPPAVAGMGASKT